MFLAKYMTPFPECDPSATLTCPRPLRAFVQYVFMIMFSAKSITCLRPLRAFVQYVFMIMFFVQYVFMIMFFGKVHDAFSRVRPECDPSEAFDVKKYRDNSCEMKKISFIQTTKYN
jgi:hypothetical protein